MIESLEQNNKFTKLMFKIKTEVAYQVSITMMGYWLLLNVILLIVNSLLGHWLIIIGFNVGFVGSLIGFFLLIWTSKWLTSNVPVKQAVSYFGFIFRMIVYATIILLVIFFKFANIVSVIGGFSILMIATITSQLINCKKEKKEK